MSFEQCRQVTSLMAGFNKTWFIAGGWAIDLFIGKETREHKDLEIANCFIPKRPTKFKGLSRRMGIYEGN